MLNQCNFIGRVSKDPETRYLANGDAVVSFTLAVSETWKDKNGEKKESVEWVNVVAWRKLAEIITAYVHKSSLLFISGKLSTRKWEDRDGNTRYSTEIICSEMKMLGGKGDKASPQGQQSQGQYDEPDPFDDSSIPF